MKSRLTPFASCIMPTANRRRFVPFAFQQFLNQDYNPKELVIVDDGDDPIEDLVPRDAAFTYLRIQPGLSLGAKRNLACRMASGDVILHWDDDDWYAPSRITRQVSSLESRGLDLCGIGR